MKTFKEYLAEAVAKLARQSMPHFKDMPDEDFNIFLSKLKSQNGILMPDTMVYAKLDGFPVKFGLDEDGKYFMETSASGPQTSPTFLKFTESKLADQEKLKGKENARKAEMLNRGAAYDSLFKDLESIPALEKIKAKYGTDFKIYSEVMYNKLGKISEDKASIKFVSIQYVRTKLGTHLTLFPYRVFKASDNTIHPKSNEIIALLLKSSNKDFKILPAKLEIKQDGINLSKALKTTDKEELKKNIADSILAASDKIPDMHQIGTEIEGIVIWVNGKEYKITTDKFQTNKKAEKLITP